jgi:hypothetical protein
VNVQEAEYDNDFTGFEADSLSAIALFRPSQGVSPFERPGKHNVFGPSRLRLFY